MKIELKIKQVASRPVFIFAFALKLDFSICYIKSVRKVVDKTMHTIVNNYFNNTKIVNRIGEIEYLNPRTPVGEFGKKQTDIIAYIDFKAVDKALLSAPISQFEILVMDAIYTLSVNEESVFTTEMVANVIAGKDVGQERSASTRFKMIEDAIERLSLIKIEIDCSGFGWEAIRSRIPDLEACYRGYVLPVENLRVKSKIKKFDKNIYILNGTPVLYQYAEALGRVVSVPAKLLSIPGTREDLLFSILKREIVKTVAIMKNKKNNYKSRSIRYERSDGEIRSLFDRIGLKKENYANESQWRKKKSKVNAMVSQIMDHLIEEKYIKGYSFNKDGGTIIGVSVDL